MAKFSNYEKKRKAMIYVLAAYEFLCFGRPTPRPRGTRPPRPNVRMGRHYRYSVRNPNGLPPPRNLVLPTPFFQPLSNN